MVNALKLLTRNDGPVAVITINRPEVRNALDNETAAALAKALRDFDRNPDTACRPDRRRWSPPCRVQMKIYRPDPAEMFVLPYQAGVS
jgi:hypothetical protein